LTLSVVDGRLALDGEVVEDDGRPQGFKAPARPPIGFALVGGGAASGSGGSAAMH
jgi:ATP-dependent Clp protease ATP-binding subunit ClpB